MKIDWARKLTSRKLWVAIAGFVSGIIVLIWHNSSAAEAIGALILSAASVVAYIIGEGLTDAAYNEANGTNTNIMENTNTNVDVMVNSDVDGNEVLDADALGEIIAQKKAIAKAAAVPFTGRDGITIDGNEVEVEE